MTEAIVFIREINKTENARVSLTHFTAKIMSYCMSKYPDLNYALIGSTLKKRASVSVFFQTLLTSAAIPGRFDLSGVSIENSDKLSLTDFAKVAHEKVETLRAGKDKSINWAQKLLYITPQWLINCLVPILDFFIYTLNINPKWIGFPPDRYGSVMVSAVGSLGFDSAYIPLFPFSRCGLAVAVGRVRQQPRVYNGEICVREVATFTFTMDHRYMDGVQPGRALILFRKMLAFPQTYRNAFLYPELK